MLNIPGRRPVRSVADAFFSRGWLLFAFLPCAQVIGRGVFNVIAAFYLIWGLVSILIRRPELDRPALALYGLLLATFTLSAALAQDPHQAFGRLLDFALYSLACWPAIAAVRSHADLRQLNGAIGMFGMAAVVYLYVTYLRQMNTPGFTPEQMMHEDNLPLLLPFILTCLHRYLTGPRTWALASMAITMVITGYVILSNGRAALLALIVGLTTYGLLALNMRKRLVLGLIATILLATVAVRGSYLLRGASTQPDLSSAVNKASNFRFELWQNALGHPPENIWLGAGMGNIPDAVLTVNGAQSANLKHLHNFLLDCWYENGVVGLGILLLLLFEGFRRALCAWRAGAPEQRRQLGTLIAASAAIVVAALFSFSYASKQFALYLFAFLGIAALTPMSTSKSGRERMPS